MLKPYLRQRLPVMGLVSLLLVSLILTACGGAATPVSEEAASSAETEEPVEAAEDPDAPTEEPEVAAAEEDVPPTEEAETAQNENLLAPNASPEATCQPVDIPENDLVMAVSDSDWVKGPAGAPVTLIEYGDFQ